MIGNIYISGQIGEFDGVTGVTLIDVISQVKKQPDAISFNVHINSEGGLVDVGFDIFYYLKALGKPVTTIGSGIVASIATVIFMAGSTRMVRENTPFMIHMPWGGGAGNADELEAFTAELRNIEKKLTDFYKKELSLESEAVEPLLKNETWLSPEQLDTLGFTNSQPVKAVAVVKTNFKPNNNDMTEKDKSWMEGLFSKVLAKFSGAKAMIVQDANGTEIDFAGLADGDTVAVGATATVDGAPADGEYTLPDGTTYVFAAGSLTEIKPAESGDNAELDTANARIAELEAELVAAKAETTTTTTAMASIKKEVEDLKTQIFSKYKLDGKVDPKKKTEPADRAAGLKNYLETKKGK